MAAKQGLTAQIYQASEDTKRAVLNRAPAGIKSHTWLSNLNTTCTIKSAPPRTPEVMSLLSTKCGWLAKRNEQHVWQKRWCCVVPHTFLYYFEGVPEVSDRGEDNGWHEGWSGGGVNTNQGSVQISVAIPFQHLDQDALNAAVKDGYNDHHVTGLARASFYLPNLMGGGGNQGADAAITHASTPHAGGGHGPLGELGMGGLEFEDPALAVLAEGGGGNPANYQFTSSNMQPVGIIDLECYSAINRSRVNPTVLELAGDSITNPDLRSFFFQSSSVEESDSWTQALLNDRHQSLKDESEAYRQVCDSFPLQLRACSDMIDAAEAKSKEMEKEAYSVRSAAEEGRRRVVALVRETLERKCWKTSSAGRSRSRSPPPASPNRRRGGRSRNSAGGGVGAFPPFGDDRGSAAGGGGGSRANSSVNGSDGGESAAASGSGGDGNGGGGGGKNATPPTVDVVLDGHCEALESHRTALLRELEAALSSPAAAATSDVFPPVRTLAAYFAAVASSHADLRPRLREYEAALRRSVEDDRRAAQDLRGAVEGRDVRLAEAERKHARMASDLREDLVGARRESGELSKQLDTHRMEFGMYQSATKTKLSELQQHKKILKREVIDLRKKIDELGSENTTVEHVYEKVNGQHRIEKERNATLERYVERLEKQVGVQQNMMEMMSQGGGPSVLGKIVGPGVASCGNGGGGQGDAGSVSGFSVGSNQMRRDAGGGGSIVGRGGRGGNGSVYGISGSSGLPSARPRPLVTMPLPPGSSSSKMRHHDVSPLPTPKFAVDDGKANAATVDAGAGFDDDKERRDTSDAYYRSASSSEAGSPRSNSDGDGDVTFTSKMKSHHLSVGTDASGNDGGGGGGASSSKESSVLALPNDKRMMNPKSPNEGDVLSGDASELIATPVQSNAGAVEFTEEPFDAGGEGGDAEARQRRHLEMPTLELKTDAGGAAAPDVRMKIVSIKDTPFSAAGGALPVAEADRCDEDDMDDNKSRVSDITEDRTQRQLDDDLAERRKILLAYVSNATAAAASPYASSAQQRRLETIENMIPNGGGVNRGNAARGGVGVGGAGGKDDVENRDLGDEPSVSLLSMGSYGSTGDISPGSRVSVAQRARIEADNRSNVVRLRDRSTAAASRDHGCNDRDRNTNNDPASCASSDTTPFRGSSGAGLQRSNSFFSKLGKAIESVVDNSVLGIQVPSEGNYEHDYTDDESEATTTLQERVAKQRLKQVAFLRKKGLLDDESSLHGGAGGSVTGSSPSRKTTPMRGVASRRV